MPLGVGTVAPKALLEIPLGAHGHFSWFQACYACHITHPPRSFQAVWGNALPVVCRKGYFVERSRGRSPHWVFSGGETLKGYKLGTRARRFGRAQQSRQQHGRVTKRSF